MKKTNKILTLAYAIAALCSCSDKSIDDTIVAPLPAPSGNVIQFDTEVKSRGTLFTEEFLNGDFGVYGYHYAFANNWNTAKVQATPNTFFQQQVKWTTSGSEKPTEGYYGYTYSSFTNGPVDNNDDNSDSGDKDEVRNGHVKWNSSYRYSFFAYHPYTGLALSDESSEGTPYITYELPDSPEDMIDIMTGSVIDTDVASSTTVAFHMHHRLSAIDLVARNFYEYKEARTDDNGETVYDKYNITINVTSAKVVLSNIRHSSTSIFMDGTSDPKPIYDEGETNKTKENERVISKTYNILNSGETAISLYDTNGKMEYLSKGDRTLLMIPQSIYSSDAPRYVKVVPTVTYTKSYVDGNGATLWYLNENDEKVTTPHTFTYTPGSDSSVKEISLDRELQEGRRYYIQLTFTAAAISINILTADEWNDRDINYEFE